MNIMATGVTTVTLLMAGTACQAAPERQLEAGSAYRLSAAESRYVQAGVKRTLKDPESSRFQNLIASRDSKGVITVCGFVNARNSYGGYTGMQPFVGILLNKPALPKDSRFLVASFGSDRDKARGVIAACQAAGVQI